MPHDTATLILIAVRDLREEFNSRLDRFEERSHLEHKDTLRRVQALEKAGTEAATQAKVVVRSARCAAGTIAALSGLAAVLSATGVL